jgi:hypothetical protein
MTVADERTEYSRECKKPAPKKRTGFFITEIRFYPDVSNDLLVTYEDNNCFSEFKVMDA